MELLLLLQDIRNPVLDAIVLTVTRLGEELFALVPLLLCYWCIDKRLGLRIGFTFFAGGIANQFSKFYDQRNRSNRKNRKISISTLYNRVVHI